MDMFTLVTIIIIVVSVLLLIFCFNYNKFQNYVIRMNEAEAEIDSTLRKRYDLLNKSIVIIKANTKIEENIMKDIEKLRSQKISNFDFDRQLYPLINVL